MSVNVSEYTEKEGRKSLTQFDSFADESTQGESVRGGRRARI